MTQGKKIGAALVAAAAMLCVGAPARADAHGDRDDGAAHAFGRGHAIRPYFGLGFGYGYGPYWGPYWANGWGGPWGWGGPYWGPGYYAEPGPSLGYAMIQGFGAIEMHVKPKQAQVWVDGKYVAQARDLDGSPTYLWLKAGDHDIQVYEQGYVTFNEKVDVRAGVRKPLDIRLEAGPSQPPTPQTAQSR